MRMPNALRVFCVFAMSLIISHLPSVAFAEEMISTSAVVDEMSRTEAEQKVRGYLDREDVQKALVKQGLSPDELSRRVAGLSVHELNQLSHQMEQARYGGDILFTVLIVVLIIYLVKRI